jgi:hypothetical protein
MLRDASVSDRMSRIMLWICLQIVILAVLLLLPVYISLKIGSFAVTGAIAFILSIFFNSLNVAAVLVALLIAILLLIHRFMWPLFERPLYALQRFHFVFKYRAWLWSSGVGLIVLAVTGIPKWLAIICEKVLPIHVSSS